MPHIKLKIRVSQNLVRLKGKGRQKKKNHTNNETKQQQKEKNNVALGGVQIVERGGHLNAWNRLAGKGPTHSRPLATNVDRFIKNVMTIKVALTNVWI